MQTFHHTNFRLNGKQMAKSVTTSS